MKPRTLAVLALVVAGLAAFVLLYERELPSSEEREALERRVFRVEADAIVELEIEAGGRRMVLEREAPPPEAPEASLLPAPPVWRIVAPLTARADRGLVERLTAELANLEISRRLEGAAPTEVGLDPPRGRIAWRSEEGEGSLELGAAVPASSSVVVAASAVADPVVVGSGLVEHLERAPGDWRARELVDARRDDVERIRLVPRAGEELVLTRRGEGYAVERPGADAADRELVEPLIGELAGLSAEKFLDAPLGAEEEGALADGPGRIELSLRGRTNPVVIELGAPLEPEGWRALRVDGQAVLSSARLDEAVGHEPSEWRARSWSVFESWRIERLRVEDKEGVLELVRTGGDWSRDGRTIPYAVAADLLHSITSARADRVIAQPQADAYPVASPIRTIVLTDAEGAEETLTSYGAREGAVPARVSGRAVVLLLPSSVVAEIVERIAAAREAEAEIGAPDEEPAAGD